MKKLIKKLSMLFALGAMVFGSGLAIGNVLDTNKNDVVARAAEPIAIDASKTKVEGAGIHIYLKDKPAITIDDITATIVSFESVTFAGYRDRIMAGTNKVHYIVDSGWFHSTLAVGFPDNGDQKMVVNLSYTLGGVEYSQNLTFVGNFYQEDLSNDEIIAKVEDLIAAIGTVEFTNASKAKIEDARAAYDELDDSLKASVSNYDVLIAAEAEYERLSNETELVEKGIEVDDTRTRINGAGVEIYIVDKPAITVNDIEITIVSFESTQFAGYKDQILNNGAKAPEYNSATGRLFFQIQAGFPDNTDMVLVFNVNYVYDGTFYNQNLTFKGNHFQKELTDEEKIAKVEETIAAIGTVAFTPESKTLIDAARTAYDELDESLKASVSNYETLTAAEAEYLRLENETSLSYKGIRFDASKTKMEGAGIHIYFADKPQIAVEDIEVKAVSFKSTIHAGFTDVMMRTPNKVHYIANQGWLLVTVANGFASDFTFIANVSYTINKVVYTQNLTFVDNVYQSNPFPTISNTDALTASAGTNYFLHGNVKNITNTTTGEFNFYDADGVYVNVLSSGLLGSTYENMSEKLADGDNVVVYGTVSNVDGVATMENATIVSVNGLVLEETFKLAADVIKADTCKDYANAEDYQTRYDALSADNQAIFASITVNCKVNEDDADLSGSVNLLDKLTYMGQLNSVNNYSAQTILNNLVASNNVNLVLVIGLLGLILVAGYYFLNKKKFAK